VSVLCFRDQQGALMLPKSQIPQACSLCCGAVDAPLTVALRRFAVQGAGFWLSGLDQSRVSSSAHCYCEGTQTLSVACATPRDNRVELKTGIEMSCKLFGGVISSVTESVMLDECGERLKSFMR
jgi:hypothetical protein